ncbi:hypothetical protein Plhal304r1_c004g0016141 [Plasmopara halstedii]
MRCECYYLVVNRRCYLSYDVNLQLILRRISVAKHSSILSDVIKNVYRVRDVASLRNRRLASVAVQRKPNQFISIIVGIYEEHGLDLVNAIFCDLTNANQESRMTVSKVFCD